MKKFLIAILIVLFAVPCFGADQYLYVRDGATGTNCNGWGATAACDQLTDANDKVDRASYDNIYIYVADGTYAGGDLDAATSGSTMIYVTKATASAHGTDTDWVSTYGDGVAAFTWRFQVLTSYWTFDGVEGGGPGSWKTGHLMTLAAGTDLDGFVIGGVSNQGVGNIHFKHLAMSGDRDDLSRSVGIKGAYGNSANNITISYCWIYDHFKAPLQLVSYNNVIVEYSFLGPNGDHGTYDPTNWSHGSGLTFEDIDEMDIRYNIIEDIAETMIFGIVNDDPGDVATDWRIYGNIIRETGASSIGQEFVLKIARSYTEFDRFRFHHNTIVNLHLSNLGIYSIGNNGSDILSKNNLYYNNSNTTITFQGTHTYNYYSDNNSEPTEATGQFETGDPFADSDYNLASATDVGDTTIGVTYSTDMLEEIRGADGVWDRGALEYTGVDATAPILSTATIASDGLTLTLVFNENTSQGGSYSDSHYDLDCAEAGNGTGVTYYGGNGTTTHTYTIAETIYSDDTCNFDYDGTANSLEDGTGNDLAQIDNKSVTNNSTEEIGEPIIPAGSGGTMTGGGAGTASGG